MKKTKFFYIITILFLIFCQQNLLSEDLKGNFIGIVKDKELKKPLQGVTIKILNTKFGTFTDKEGRFEIKDIPVGKYAVQFTYIGYEKFILQNVFVNTAMPMDMIIELTPKVIELGTAEVRAGYFIKEVESATSTQTLNFDDIKSAPGVQEDVIRATALLPGVGVTSAGRNDLIVRGGAPFENLFIVDDIEIPNINHFGSQGSSGGPLSIINIDFVKDVKFSSGGFEAKYSNKLSSLTDIKLRQGNKEKFGTILNLSATGFGMNFEGPISKNSTILFSLRRSYLDLIFKAAGFSFIPEYWDLQTKIVWDINDRNSLSYLLIGALDDVTFNNDNEDNRFKNSRILAPEQRQYFTGLSWQRLFNNGYAKFIIGRTFTSFNTSQLDSNLNNIFKNISSEGEISLKADFFFEIAKKTNLNFGNQFKYASKLEYNINIPGFVRTDKDGNPVPLEVDTNFNAFNNSTYINLTSAIGQFRYTLGGVLNYYSITNPEFYFSPRILALYQINEVSALALSLGRYYQPPSYIWLVGGYNQNLKALRADQIVLSYNHTPLEDVKVQLEIYNKWYSNYTARIFRPQAVLSPSGFDDVTNDIPFGLEPLQSSAKGYSRGIELFIQKKLSEIPLYGLLSLTLSESKFTSIDNIERVSAFDQTFILNLSLGYRFNSEWEVVSKFRFSTGLPTTPYTNTGQLDFSKYNQGERLPVFHQLDLRIDKTWFFKNLSMVTYIDVQNIYGRKNISQLRWNSRTKNVEYSTSIGVLPSIGITIMF